MCFFTWSIINPDQDDFDTGHLFLMYLMYAFIAKYFCIPITFHNPLKVCFTFNKYLITILTRPKQIGKLYFFKKPVLTDL